MGGFSQAEAHPLHLECADLCDFAPKCGKLDCIICGSGELCSRSPLVFLVAKKRWSDFVYERRGLMFNYSTARQWFSVDVLRFAFFSLRWSYQSEFHLTSCVGARLMCTKGAKAVLTSSKDSKDVSATDKCLLFFVFSGL